jgi:mono/diheme cytochrome c family protein
MKGIRGLTTAALLVLAACGGEADEPDMTPGTPDASVPAPLPQAGTDTGMAAGGDLAGGDLPAGVTPDMVQAGSSMFATSVCGACHGPQGAGVPGVGPNLTDDAWLNVDGGFESIVQVINDGVPQPKESATPMPPKGGNAGLTDEQVRQLAAYIYAQSHDGA